MEPTQIDRLHIRLLILVTHSNHGMGLSHTVSEIKVDFGVFNAPLRGFVPVDVGSGQIVGERGGTAFPFRF